MSAQCPACEQNGALRVARQGMSGYLLSLFYIYPYRCKACWRNFRAIRWGTRYVLRQTNRRQYRRFETNLPVFLSWQDTPGEGIVTNLALGGCRLKSNLELTEKSRRSCVACCHWRPASTARARAMTKPAIAPTVIRSRSHSRVRRSCSRSASLRSRRATLAWINSCSA